jgi:hypothetical protein
MVYYRQILFIVRMLMVEIRHVDGHDYMWALSELLDGAKEAIFILVRTA